MSKRSLSIIAFLSLLFLVGLLISYFISKNFIRDKDPTILNVDYEKESGGSDSSAGYKVSVFADQLSVPWSILFTSQDRILVSERTGDIKVIENGRLLDQPLKSFSEVSNGGEEGLMSIEKHPDYLSNKLLYASYAYEKEGEMYVKVVQFKDGGDSTSDDKVIIDNIVAAKFHAGTDIRFGPDEKLYISTGDATDRNLAQDMDSLSGKILRLNADGSIPDDNPFNNSPIWSLGHRNPQGIAWHPDTGEMWETEHGPSGFDGLPGGDEVNQISKGGNYGWPEVSHQNNRDGFIAPQLVFTPAIAPGSAMFYSGGLFEEWKNNLFFGGLKGEGVWRAEISEDGKNIISQEKLSDINYGRTRDVVEGPDGKIYFSSSNTDGRGEPTERDDKIYVIELN